MKYIGQAPGSDPGVMDTYLNNYINPFNPVPEKIVIEDIAHHLSLICRYCGACAYHYSVAQHSVYCWDVARRLCLDKQTRLGALLHDASEAYFGDYHRPIKYTKHFSGIRKADEFLQNVIFWKFGVEHPNHSAIKDIDNRVCAAECRVLMKSKGAGWQNMPEPADILITPWSSRLAEEAFLRAFHKETD